MFSLFLEFHFLGTLCVFRICMSSVASSSYDYIAYSAMSFPREGSFFAVDQKEDERPYVHRLAASVQTRRVIWHMSFHWDLLSRGSHEQISYIYICIRETYIYRYRYIYICIQLAIDIDRFAQPAGV